MIGALVALDLHVFVFAINVDGLTSGTLLDEFTNDVDGFTNMVISQVLASSILKIYFYPSETVATSRALAGRRAVQDYRNPRVVGNNTLRIAR